MLGTGLVLRRSAAVAVLAWCSSGAGAEAPPCPMTIDRLSIVDCARATSLSAKAERYVLESFDGRALAARTVLPSNPVLTLSGGVPAESVLPKSETLWGARLTQEIEIGGQRGARRNIVERERHAQESNVAVAERADIAAALDLYFGVLAARDAAAVAERSSAVARALRNLASAQAAAGIASPADALLANATAIELEASSLAAQQRLTQSMMALATVLGRDPTATLTVEGDLIPLALAHASQEVLVDEALAGRHEVLAAAAELGAAAERVRLLQRSRAPSPSIAVAATNDWVDERRVGVELSIPIPVPAPIGRTNRGEIDEALALVARAETDLERVRRNVRTEVLAALNEVATRRAQLALYDDERVTGAEQTLQAVAEEIAARRLPLRDALLMQRTLLALLYARVEARHDLCRASVLLARVSGRSYDSGDSQ